MSGWVKVHRTLMNHWCSSNPNFLAVWLRLLIEANHSENKVLFNGSVITIKRGQLIYGRNSFKCGVSISKLRSIIDTLTEEQMISQQKTNKYSIITITKYSEYQINDQQTTIKPPTDNQQIATLKECKERKEEESIVAPLKGGSKKGTRILNDWQLPDEYKTWAIENGIDEDRIQSIADRFKDYWLGVAGAKGVKLDWLATWRNWIRRDLDRPQANGLSMVEKALGNG